MSIFILLFINCLDGYARLPPAHSFLYITCFTHALYFYSLCHCLQNTSFGSFDVNAVVQLISCISLTHTKIESNNLGTTAGINDVEMSKELYTRYGSFNVCCLKWVIMRYIWSWLVCGVRCEGGIHVNARQVHDGVRSVQRLGVEDEKGRWDAKHHAGRSEIIKKWRISYCLVIGKRGSPV